VHVDVNVLCPEEEEEVPDSPPDSPPERRIIHNKPFEKNNNNNNNNNKTPVGRPIMMFDLKFINNTAKIATAGNRTRINCLEGNYANHYTTVAVVGGCCC
jgi:hypothetical protein